MPRRSGRYPWGSGDRPYQSLGGKSKKHGGGDGLSGSDSQRQRNLKTAKKVSRETSNALRTIDRNIDDGSRSNEKKWERMDLSNMTDQELRDKINRENLEIQYSKTFNSQEPEISKGKKFVKNMFKYGIEGLEVAGTVISIILAIEELRNMNAKPTPMKSTNPSIIPFPKPKGTG